MQWDVPPSKNKKDKKLEVEMVGKKAVNRRRRGIRKDDGGYN